MQIHFNGYKARYSLLNHQLQPIVRSRKIRNINIFINLDDLFHTLHRPLVGQEFQVGGEEAPIELVHNIFNLIGHYKNWASKMGVNAKVYAIYSSVTHSFKNNMYVSQYRKKFFEIMHEANGNYYFINKALRDSYPILHVISKYLPGVYIIDSKYLEPSMVPYYISKDLSPADWNILITRDTYDLQYCYMSPWTYVSPKGDNSSVVSIDNMWDYLIMRERIFKDGSTRHYDHNLYKIAKTIVGDSFRNIPRLRRVGWITMFKLLDQMPTADTPSAIQAELFSRVARQNKVSIDDYNRNLACTDVTQQYDGMLEIDKALISRQIIDVEDYQSLDELNRSKFHRFPLNIPFLTSQPHRSPFDL